MNKKPSSQDILDFVKSRNGRASKADIAKHFKIHGDDRVGLKQTIKELLAKGLLHQGTFRHLILPGTIKKEVAPKQQQPAETRPLRERIPMTRITRDDAADDALMPTQFFGIFQPLRTGGGMILPVSRKDKHPVVIADGHTLDAARDDLVEAVFINNQWRIKEVLSGADDAGMVSLIAIKTMDIPHVFPPEVLQATSGLTVPELGKRTDLRDVPLVTIDGEDARDFDDAVFAEPDTAPDNKGGWKIIVAIADVAHYVRPGSALDEEAYIRGNSVYFPDRVVPMLPEALSNDLCSLRPHEERACMAAIMHVNIHGDLINAKVVRGLMTSQARLTYNQVQAALDGHGDDMTTPLMEPVLKPLYGAYQTLLKNRAARGAVELDLPERKVILKDGNVQDISKRARFDSHKLIEEMMILANVATATVLEEAGQDALYRIHPKPDAARWALTKEFLTELGVAPKHKGLTPEPKDLQSVLARIEGREEAALVNDIVLRSMSQANYSPDNVGHFGLALERYAHFTSPIRRYADLIVHRALIRILGLGDDGLTDSEMKRLEQIGSHISDRERVAQSAERETIDRYIALYLQDQVGATFAARVSGVTKFGLFVTIEPSGADGLIPIRTLPQDFYVYDEKRHALSGRRNGLTFRLAMPLTVRLIEVEATTGRLMMELIMGDYGDGTPPSRERRERQRDYAADDRRRSQRRRGPGPKPDRSGSKNPRGKR